MIKVNSAGFDTAKRLIKSGAIDRSSEWSFDAADGNALLGANGDDWANYSAHHLAIDTAAEPETKAHYKYPIAKAKRVYRRGVIAAKQRAAAQGETGLVNAADDLLTMIDGEKKGLLETIKDALLTVLGLIEETNPIVEMSACEDDDESAFKVFKSQTGEWRWFAWVSNKWVDRENEILTDAAHKEFVVFLNENPQYAPELWLYHTPGTSHEHKADWWDYQNGFLMFSGVLTDEEAQRYQKNDEPLGMSHGFFVLSRYGRYITKYRTFELTVLPLSRAANANTAFMTMEENMSKQFDPRQREFLVSKLGEARVVELETNTEKQAEVLEAAGTDWKALNEEFEQEIERERAEAVQPVVKQVLDEIVKALNLEATFKVIAEKLQVLPQLETKVAALEAELVALKEMEDAKLAKAFAPLAPLDWGFSVRREETPETPDVKELVEAKTYSWLEELK